MLEAWEQGQVNRLERRVNQLERANWEHADFTFRLTIYLLAAAIVALVIASIVLSAGPSVH